MGPHVIYADLLNPYLHELLGSGPPGSEEALRRIVALLETLLADDDPEVRGVAVFAIAEDIKGHSLHEKARPYMGPLMTQAIELIQAP
jgi:hypothetical protein